jgi:phosphoribosyl 1,2-cyclic phosphodiesterase
MDLKAPEGLRDAAVADRLNLTAHVVEPFQTLEVGPYRVRSVRANHDPDHITALLYLIERGGRCLFYATDTGELPDATWVDLAKARGEGWQIHAVAMDHTWGLGERVNGHMNWEQFLEQIARLREIGLLAEGARVFAHHLAHHNNPPHEELAEFAAGHGYEAAYDGLVVDI